MALKKHVSTILVVDDSEEVRELIEMVLGNEFKLRFAANGKEGIEQYKKEKPDLILMDVEMPEMDGYTACRQIKSMVNNTFLPIIFITSKSDLESKKIGLQSGAEDYLSKPFEPEELMARVHATLRTKRLYNQLMEAYKIIDKERDIIANIQRSLLCNNPPKVPGFKLFSDYQPSSKAGGDYYDFIQIDDDHFGVLVSDVSGHGTPAAVLMAMMQVLLRSSFSKIRSPKETLEKMNQFLCENLIAGYFITAFYGIIHLPTLRLKYASAGHNPPFLIDSGSETVRKLITKKGFPLAILPDNIIEECEVQLQPKCKLILYTDGLTEARGPNGEMFGDKRLEGNMLELGKDLNAEKLGIKIKEVIQEFTHCTEFQDDYTLVILEVESD